MPRADARAHTFPLSRQPPPSSLSFRLDEVRARAVSERLANSVGERVVAVRVRAVPVQVQHRPHRVRRVARRREATAAATSFFPVVSPLPLSLSPPSLFPLSLLSLSLSLLGARARGRRPHSSRHPFTARASCVRRPLARPLRSAPPQCSFRSDAPALVCQACARGCRQPAPPLRGRRRPPPRPSPSRGGGDSGETAEMQLRGSRDAAERQPR